MERNLEERERIAWDGVPGGKLGSRLYVTRLIGEMRIIQLYLDLLRLHPDLDSPAAVAYACLRAPEANLHPRVNGRQPQEIFRNNARHMRMWTEIARKDPLEQHRAQLRHAMHRRVQLGLAISKLVHMRLPEI